MNKIRRCHDSAGHRLSTKYSPAVVGNHRRPLYEMLLWANMYRNYLI